MESLYQSEKQNSVDKKGGRKWRKNTEVKISQTVAETNEPPGRTPEDEHKNLWRQMLGNEPGDKIKPALTEKAEVNARIVDRNQQAPKAEINVSEWRRRNATEAHNIHGGLHPEAIGQVLISAAETRSNQRSPEGPKSNNESQMPAAESAQSMSIDKHVETMSREDLLELSSKIIIDGSSLRQTYETHLIGEKALRRLVAEHLRGGNVHEELRKELVQHEIDFERDPMMRGHDHHNPSGNSGEALNNLLKQANVGLEIAADKKAAATSRQAIKKAKAYQPQLYHSRAMDITLVSIIAILLALVIALALTRN